MIVCLGAFDGYHRGHLALFRAASELARAQKTAWKVVTFTPHPRLVLGGLTARLFTERETEVLRSSLEIPDPIEIPFTREFAATEPEDFLNRLKRAHDITGLVVGEAFRFGKNRRGDANFLREYCRTFGIELRLIPQQTLHEGIVISSTRVRDMIQAGIVEQATRMLSYPWFIISEVVHGTELGRSMGYPTVNMLPSAKKLIPAEGVYAGALYHHGSWYPAAISVGRNPTFLVEGDLRIEGHIIGWHGDLYGTTPLLAFFHRLRLMTRYSGKEQLTRQLAVDCAQTQTIFGETSPIRARLAHLPPTL